MSLPDRIKTESYIYLKAEFTLLSAKHQEYSSFIENHPCFPQQKYLAEKQKVESQWAAHPTTGGGRSLENDLQSLYVKYDYALREENNMKSFINMLFARIIGYWNEIESDKREGYLSKNRFDAYLQCYSEAIETNKRLGLNSGSQSIKIVETIYSQIAKTKSA